MKSCLIVDDSKVIRKVARHILETLEFEPAVVVEALTRYESGKCEFKPQELAGVKRYPDRVPEHSVLDPSRPLRELYNKIRAADPDQAEPLVGEMMDHLVSFTANEDLQVLRGRKVIEIRNSGVNKGAAVRHWLDGGGYDFVLACGDDLTDEDTIDELKQALGQKFESAWVKIGSVNGWVAASYHIKVAVRDEKAFWLSSGNWQSSNQPDADPLNEQPQKREYLTKYNREWHAVVEHEG